MGTCRLITNHAAGHKTAAHKEEQRNGEKPGASPENAKGSARLFILLLEA